MKVYFKTKDRSYQATFNITEKTTLREIKHLYELASSSNRAQYIIFSYAATGSTNEDVTQSFIGYMQQVHKITILPTRAQLTLKIHEFPATLDNLAIYCSPRKDILALEELSKHQAFTPLFCPINFELIADMPIKLNNRFYDFKAIAKYLKRKSKDLRKYWYLKQEDLLVCPHKQELPERFKKIVQKGADETELDTDFYYPLLADSFTKHHVEYERKIQAATTAAKRDAKPVLFSKKRPPIKHESQKQAGRAAKKPKL